MWRFKQQLENLCVYYSKELDFIGREERIRNKGWIGALLIMMHAVG